MEPKKFRRILKLMNLYPPFIGAGIRLTNINKTATKYDVQLKLRWWNRNAYGTHFGGSLFAMCDPWYVFAAGAFLGKGYILWDKSASIKFLRPGKGKVTATFEISDEQLAAIKTEVDSIGKQTYHFSTYVLGPKGEKVAFVEKEIYVKKKQ